MIARKNSKEITGAADLVNHHTDWGVTVSEAVAKRGIAAKCMVLAFYFILLLASLVVMPVLAGLVFVPGATGLINEIAIIGALILLAIGFNWQSKKGPRNSLQIDYAACEVRLGSQNAGGTFVRHRVIGFRAIEDVYVDQSDKASTSLCFRLNTETVTINFFNTNETDLEEISTKIAAARQSAKLAPIRSRIQSTLLGFEASWREVGQRVKSRTQTRFS